MPAGKVRWYDVEKGFGFLVTDDGEDVFVHASALPEGTTSLKQGARVDFGIVDGKRGKQALTVTLLEPAPSVVKSGRKPAEDMPQVRIGTVTRVGLSISATAVIVIGLVPPVTGAILEWTEAAAQGLVALIDF